MPEKRLSGLDCEKLMGLVRCRFCGWYVIAKRRQLTAKCACGRRLWLAEHPLVAESDFYLPLRELIPALRGKEDAERRARVKHIATVARGEVEEFFRLISSDRGGSVAEKDAGDGASDAAADGSIGPSCIQNRQPHRDDKETASAPEDADARRPATTSPGLPPPLPENEGVMPEGREGERQAREGEADQRPHGAASGPEGVKDRPGCLLPEPAVCTMNRAGEYAAVAPAVMGKNGMPQPSHRVPYPGGLGWAATAGAPKGYGQLC